MAFMIPAEQEDFTTPGEGAFYRFLQAVAKPDHHYIAWYLPDIQGYEPDFIVYSNQFGLVTQSPICSDPPGRCFQDNMKLMFSPLFDFSITPGELNHLKQLLFPVVRIDLPCREEHQNQAEDALQLKILVKHQESIARQYGGGHRLITGPSGSGKTLILVHRAAL